MMDICLTITLPIEELNTYLPDFTLTRQEIHAHLLLLPDGVIKLKVFDESFLMHRLTSWEEETKEKLWPGKHINILSINNKDDIVEIDFSSAQTVSYEESTQFYENGKQYFLIGFSNVRIVYKPLDPGDPESNTASFSLNDAAREILKDEYSYWGPNWHSPNIWEARHRHEEFIKFGEIEFLLNYRFYKLSQSADSQIIKNEPRLLIKHDNAPEALIVNYAKLICAVCSFYINIPIYLNFFRINKVEYTSTWTRRISKEPGLTRDFSIKFEFRLSIQELLRKVNPGLVPHVDFFSKIVSRFNLAREIEGEAEFMILYNIIEQIRNFYISNKQVNQEFNFIVSKNDTNNLIRLKLKEIGQIVDDAQREDFERHIVNHISTLKYMPMSKQFEVLFEYLRIDLTGLPVDFKVFKRLRNMIFHGFSIDKNDELQQANEVLPKIASLLMLNILGIREYNLIFSRRT